MWTTFADGWTEEELVDRDQETFFRFESFIIEERFVYFSNDGINKRRNDHLAALKVVRLERRRLLRERKQRSGETTRPERYRCTNDSSAFGRTSEAHLYSIRDKNSRELPTSPLAG